MGDYHRDLVESGTHHSSFFFIGPILKVCFRTVPLFAIFCNEWNLCICYHEHPLSFSRKHGREAVVCVSMVITTAKKKKRGQFHHAAHVKSGMCVTPSKRAPKNKHTTVLVESQHHQLEREHLRIPTGGIVEHPRQNRHNTRITSQQRQGD